VVVVEDEHTNYPPPLASHGDVLQDQQLFLGLLQDLLDKLQDAEPAHMRPQKFRVPTGAHGGAAGCCDGAPAAAAAAALVPRTQHHAQQRCTQSTVASPAGRFS
jgi:hypothetical protein